MSNESDMHRRKFMEIGIVTISGTMAALSAIVLARFAVGLSFVKIEDGKNFLSTATVPFGGDASEGV
jgi:hypothetical protein